MPRFPMKAQDRSAANRYGLVVLLLCVVYVVSASVETSAGVAFAMLIQLVTLWLAFSASESHTARRIVGIACVVVAVLDVVAFGFGRFFDWGLESLQILAVVSIVLYLIAPLVILRHLIRRPVVDVKTLLGAVSVYLMLGLMFAFSYRAISLYQTNPPFFGANGPGQTADFLFFSFITLTTTGYGDLVPAANPGQSLAALEAIVGQLFLVTAVAKIVNDWRPSPTGTSGKDAQ